MKNVCEDCDEDQSMKKLMKSIDEEIDEDQSMKKLMKISR